jgi:leucyl-tRNA synthetase
LVILSSFAPHITEELWHVGLGKDTSIIKAEFPVYDESYLKENEFEYPISINGKVRAKMSFALETPKEDIEKQVMDSEIVQKWLEGKTPKRFILVPKKIVNIVI